MTEHWDWAWTPSQNPKTGGYTRTFYFALPARGQNEALMHLRCSLQRWWWGDLQGGGTTRPLQPWLSASCPPAAALQSNAGLSIKGAWLAPQALRRSVPPSSLACIVQGSHRRPMMAIITRPRMLTSQTTTKSTAKRKTSSRRRKKEVSATTKMVKFWLFHTDFHTFGMPGQTAPSPSCLPWQGRRLVSVCVNCGCFSPVGKKVYIYHCLQWTDKGSSNSWPFIVQNSINSSKTN